jgi:hypothetical protein
MIPAPNDGPVKLTCVVLRWLVLAVSLSVTATVYARALFFEFAYDDFGQIVYNQRIKSWMLALTYFKTHVWAQSSAVALYYRPVFMLWLAANYKLFGLNPLYWHLAVIGIHLVCCVLLNFFVWRLTEDKWVTAVAVLLFGLHPAHLESVAWVSGATEPLLAALLLGSLLCYMKHRDSRKTTDGWQWASLLLASLAVLAKETALIIPALVFSYQWIFPRRATSGKARLWASVRAATPYAVISLLFLISRTLALHSLTPAKRAGLRSTLLAWPQVVAFYSAHGLFPFRLSVFYNLVSVTHPGLWNFALPLVLVLGAGAALCYVSRRSRLWAFLCAWCVIMLVPLLNVTFWNNVENVHDRYLYLPSVAICVMLASALARLKQLNFTAAAAATLAIAAGYAAVTMLELQYWQDDNVLAQRGISVSPGHPIALQLAGNALIRQQAATRAIPFLVEALDVQPDNVDTLCSLSFCYSEINALPLAEESATKAVALDPAEPRAHLLLGIVRLKQKQLGEAEAEIRRGIGLQHLTTGIVLYHYYLGNVLYAKGDSQGAIQEYRLEVLNDPATDPAASVAQTRIDQLKGQLRVPSQQHRQ